jgi:putative membrane protein
MQAARFWTHVVVLAAVALLAGCSDDENGGGGGTIPTGQEDMMLTDAEILRVLEVANDGEVMLSQLAVQKATSADVRGFAERMVNEHTAARQRLTPLMQNQGLQAVDNNISQQHQEEIQRMMNMLENVQGENFDLAFMDAQVAAHARTAMVGDALLTPQAQNQSLVQELRILRVDVQTHLQEAAAIQAGLFK